MSHLKLARICHPTESLPISSVCLKSYKEVISLRESLPAEKGGMFSGKNMLYAGTNLRPLLFYADMLLT